MHRIPLRSPRTRVSSWTSGFQMLSSSISKPVKIGTCLLVHSTGTIEPHLGCFDRSCRIIDMDANDTFRSCSLHWLFRVSPTVFLDISACSISKLTYYNTFLQVRCLSDDFGDPILVFPRSRPFSTFLYLVCTQSPDPIAEPC